MTSSGHREAARWPGSQAARRQGSQAARQPGGKAARQPIAWAMESIGLMPLTGDPADAWSLKLAEHDRTKQIRLTLHDTSFLCFPRTALDSLYYEYLGTSGRNYRNA